MKKTESHKERELLQTMVGAAIHGKTSIFKECFETVLDRKISRFVSEERERMANVFFTESHIKKGALMVKEDTDSTTANDVMYNKLYVTDADLFNREHSHMPEWMQDASPHGTEIDPVREKDAIDLSSKFHSVEFTSDHP